MNRIIFFLLVVCLAASCRQEKIPADILSQPRMKAVLWDLMRADEFIMNYAVRDSGFNKKEESLQLYEQVYSVNKTTKAQFEKSLTYYKVHPDQFKGVLDSLEKMKNRIQDEQYRPKSSDSSKRRIKLTGPK